MRPDDNGNLDKSQFVQPSSDDEDPPLLEGKHLYLTFFGNGLLLFERFGLHLGVVVWLSVRYIFNVGGDIRDHMLDWLILPMLSPHRIIFLGLSHHRMSRLIRVLPLHLLELRRIDHIDVRVLLFQRNLL